MKRFFALRGQVLRHLVVSVATLLIPAASVQAQLSKPLVEVWKSPTCGCCKDWIKHLEANGFQVRSRDTGNSAIRQELGMPNHLGSCHTAQVEGYVIEGHVPAKEIKRLLAERPKALGLSVPEMPIGSPGMDGAEYGGQTDPFDVLLVQRDGKTRVFAAYRHATRK